MTFINAKTFDGYLRNREQVISEKAEYFWFRRGCSDGSPELDWFRAEAELDQELLSEIELGIPS